MRPVFTLHAGEALTWANTSHGPSETVNIWVPAKDTGIDFLVTDSKNRRYCFPPGEVFRRDFLVTHLRPEFQTPLRACGWWTFHRDKLINSPGSYSGIVTYRLCSSEQRLHRHTAERTCSAAKGHSWQ